MNLQTALGTPTRWRPFRGPFARWPRASDAVLAVIFFCLTAMVTFEGPDDDFVFRPIHSIPFSTLLLIILANASLICRRSRPLVTLSTMWIVGVITMESVFGVIVAIYSAGRYGADDQTRFAGLGIAALGMVLNALRHGDPLTEVGFAFAFVSLVWFAGWRIGDRNAYLSLLQERAETLQREQAAEARRAVAEERTRIARELHDVVAHRVSMMTVQAGAAKTVAASKPDDAVTAMEAVETAGRQALDELRHLLDVLRPEADSADLAPQAGVVNIPQLVDQLKDAGLNITCDIDPRVTDLAAPVDLSVYRIVQEALTNVLKHAAPAARAEVSVGVEQNEIVIRVTNDGAGATTLPGAGHGIAGMRERAQLLGGRLAAGPRAEGGFQVVAHLPLEEKAT